MRYELTHDERMQLIRLTRVASTDEAKPALRHVRIGNGKAVATDGIILGVLWGSLVNQPILVDAEELRRELTVRGNRGAILGIKDDYGVTVEIEGSGLCHTINHSKGLSYPHYHELVPDLDVTTTGPPVPVDTRLLSKIAALAPGATNAGGQVILATDPDEPEKRPIRVYATNEVLLGIVMPVYLSEES